MSKKVVVSSIAAALVLTACGVFTKKKLAK